MFFFKFASYCFNIYDAYYTLHKLYSYVLKAQLFTQLFA